MATQTSFNTKNKDTLCIEIDKAALSRAFHHGQITVSDLHGLKGQDKQLIWQLCLLSCIE